MDPAPSPPAAITCVVADDQIALRKGLAQLLAEQGCDVVREAADGAEALAAIEELKPRVAILAAVMPRLAGVEVVRRAAAVAPETASIVYTGLADQDGLVAALNAGARGFVLKETPPEELLRAVLAVAAGAVYVDPAVGKALPRPTAHPDTKRPALSLRERDILSLLGTGMTTKEIAGILFISPETVRTYIRRAMQKLDARTRTQAVATAIRRSLIS